MIAYWDLETIMEGIKDDSGDLYRKGRRHSANEVITIYVTKSHIRYDTTRGGDK